MNLEEFDRKANAILEVLKKELQKIRGGRVVPSMVEDIKVEVYNSMLPINNVGNVNIESPQCLTIQPWDKNIVQDIVKAIQNSNLGVNPVVNGDLIRLPFPLLSEERRQEFVKIMKAEVEKIRISIRMLRKEMMEFIELQEKQGSMSEDVASREKKAVQEKVDNLNISVNDISKVKEDELMKV